ncbi:cytochrome c oxidase subunit II [Lyngbya confervoides]|uniref:Cytochrome c oxidase subunit 2 n=1 Tax=Lyngbya confervoides BDU141951 TaxID=1574623 RepID=A0ABD4T4Y0_9CYAN|nr:cytochrome c oxidase subunit II [Lyngbya confervoides]MCM1983558.1 cytochrome c oxidase subunit II [Lyngbya confervoides BDU141951]
MKIPSTITALLVGIVITLASLWYGQNNGLLPVDASLEAAKIDQLFNAMIAIATGLFLLVQGALVYSLFAFRRRKGDDSDAEPVEGNVPLEILWTAIPAVIVLWLAIYSLDVYSLVNSGGFVGTSHMAHAHTHEVARAPGAAIAASLEDLNEMGQVPPIGTDDKLHVNVTGLQYAWLFNYPDSGIISGELHIPVNQTVELDIAARDVIHAFWVPEFRLKQDAIPGQTTHLSFTPSRVGEYPVICAELCGAYHGAMKTRTIVHTPEDYQAWVASQRVAVTPDPSSTLAAEPPTPAGARLAGYAHQHHLPLTLAAAHPEASIQAEHF